MKLNFLKDWSSLWRAYLAEFLGTFVFVLVASLSVVSSNIYGDIGTVGVALATGLALGAMVFATIHISGGHLNPAVTLALWLTQKVSATSAFFYIISQVAASFAAGAVIWWLFGKSGLDFSLGGPVLGSNVTMQTAVILEAILTAVLVFAVFATMVDRRGTVSFGPLVIGLIVVVASIAVGPVTGAALNPARALGPLALSGKLDTLTVWVVGPFTGSLFGIFYEFVFLRRVKK